MMRQNRKKASERRKSLKEANVSSDTMKAVKNEIKALQIFSAVFNIKL